MKLSKEQARSLANKISQEINAANIKKKDAFLADRTNVKFIKIQKTERYKCIAKAFTLSAISSITLSNQVIDGIQCISVGASSLESLDKSILQKLYSVDHPKYNHNIYSETILDDIYIATIEADDIDSVIETIKQKYLV